MPDPVGLILTVGFVALGLAVIPLDKWLVRRSERREARRRNSYPKSWRNL